MTENTRFPKSAGDSYGSGKWVNMTHSGQQCSIAPKIRLYAGDSACLGSARHERIPGAVVVGSPALNVSV